MIEQLTHKISGPAPVDPHERRRYSRYPFTAIVEAVEIKSQVRIIGRTSDLSLGGCYVDATSSFPAGSVVRMRITKDTSTIELDATVVYSLVDMGMGVKFADFTPEQNRIMEKWVGELSGEQVPETEASRICDQTCKSDCPQGVEFQVLAELVTELKKQGVVPGAKCDSMLQKLSHAGRAVKPSFTTSYGVN